MKRMTMAVSMVPICLTIAACCFGGGTGAFNLSGPTTSVSPGFSPDPMTLSGLGGGPTAASTMNASCVGYVGLLPNHTLDVTAPMTLRVMVRSEADTTLVVRLADGTIVCNDDSVDGTNPIVDHAFPAGQHNVYIGSYSAGESPSYTLGISTNTSIVPSQMTAGSAPAPAVPTSAAPTGGAGAGVCARATECCNAYVQLVPAAAATNCTLYSSMPMAGEAGCQSAIDGYRSGLSALGHAVPAACQ